MKLALQLASSLVQRSVLRFIAVSVYRCVLRCPLASFSCRLSFRPPHGVEYYRQFNPPSLSIHSPSRHISRRCYYTTPSSAVTSRLVESFSEPLRTCIEQLVASLAVQFLPRFAHRRLVSFCYFCLVLVHCTGQAGNEPIKLEPTARGSFKDCSVN